MTIPMPVEHQLHGDLPRLAEAVAAAFVPGSAAASLAWRAAAVGADGRRAEWALALALALADGIEPAGYALRHGVCITTVRSQLQAILRKNSHAAQLRDREPVQRPGRA